MPNPLNVFTLAVLVLLTALYAPQPARAQVDVFEFETAEQERRFRQLSAEFRCPMCQNTNLADSPGGVAADLRREIYYMIVDGYTDAEIEQFMEQRYGDFIFYRPRLTTRTVLLWFGPALFFLIGGVVIFSIVRRSRRAGAETEGDLSEEERKHLDELLKKK